MRRLLLALMGILLGAGLATACAEAGERGPVPENDGPSTGVTGPALVLFYTDN